jgi:hypothetical protein
LISVKQFDVLLKVAMEQADENSRRTLLQGFLRNTDVLKELVANNQVEVVLQFVKEEHEPYWRSSLLSPILSSPDVIKHFAKSGKLDSFFELMEVNANPNSHNQALSYLVGRGDAIKILLDCDALEGLIKCIQKNSAGSYQGQFLGRLMTNSVTLQWLKAKKKTALLLTSADPEDAQARQTYLSRILSYTTSVDALIATGHFDKMVATAKEQPDNTRGTVLRGLLANRSVAQHLVKAKKVDSLLKIVQEETHPSARQAGFSGLFSNYTAMPLLIQAGHYATFRKEIDAVEDPAQRGVLFGDFLNGRNVLEEVVKQGDTDLLLEYAGSDNDNARKQFLERLFRNRNAIGLLIEKGH